MKVAPSGGPRDTTPAAVTETRPQTGATNVEEPVITVDFDDYVDRGIRNAIAVQPNVRFTTSYSGNSIDIEFLEELQPNTTYAVTIGTDWRDLDGNTPTSATSIVFSTGPDIDTGEIRGTVHGANLRNVEIFLYPNADTLTEAFSPTRDFAPYRMPVGSSGKFLIGGLKDGLYRIVAVQDQNGNGLVDGNEQYAMGSEDVRVMGDGRRETEDGIQMLLGPSFAEMSDTTKKDTVKQVVADSVRADSTVADTTRADTVEREEPGTIMGTFVDSLNLGGPYLLRFKDKAGKAQGVVRVQSGESWTVPEIQAGTYSVDVVIDANENDRYDHGLSTPFTFAEKWYPLSVTVNVRRRWTTEDVRIILK